MQQAIYRNSCIIPESNSCHHLYSRSKQWMMENYVNERKLLFEIIYFMKILVKIVSRTFIYDSIYL